jgi:hypothetical protein
MYKWIVLALASAQLIPMKEFELASFVMGFCLAVFMALWANDWNRS